MKKEKIKISWAAAAVCFLLLLFGVTIYSLAAFRGSIRYAVHQDPLEAQRYSAYYVLIAENGDNLLWSSVYKGAKQEGMENGDACVEFFGNRLFSERTAAEKLRMAIDAGVDGIILNGDGSETQELVQEAGEKGIPVVTVLGDEAADVRQCFVGVNSYHLGQEYAGRIWKLLQEMEEDSQIQVLLNSGDADPGKNTLFLGPARYAGGTGWKGRARKGNPSGDDRGGSKRRFSGGGGDPEADGGGAKERENPGLPK